MNLLDTARAVKAGKLKLADIPDARRKHVQRLIPVAGEAPKPRPGRVFDPGARFRSARTV